MYSDSDRQTDTHTHTNCHTQTQTQTQTQTLAHTAETQTEKHKSEIFKEYAKANNKHLKDHRSNEISTYLDANNLFGVSMSCKLPQGMFEWVKGEDISIDNIMNYIEVTDNEAFISEVD